MTTGLLIFTDLDGSLLNHESYRFDAAKPMLARLNAMGIPVIPTTSKTKQELIPLRRHIGNVHPFIVENGAGVFIPTGYFKTLPPNIEQINDTLYLKRFAKPRSHWQRLIAGLPDMFNGKYQTFAQAGDVGVAALTGLPPESAARANRRDFGEPVAWLDDTVSKAQFCQILEAQGATVLEGGRFLHVCDKVDKGKALQWLTHIYALNAGGHAYKSIAIGDSGNDIAMLEIADYAVLVRSPAKPFPQLQRTDNLYHTQNPAPQGWTEGVTKALATLTKE